MDIKRKLEILADAAKYDASCASSGSKRERPADGLGNTEGMGICHSYTPDGRCISLLKLLLTNYCTYDCSYCVNRISSDTPRARFTPKEVVYLTIEFYKRNYIEGLFLSSGIVRSADHTMEELIEVARSLRQDHKFGGYIHLKAVPGASPELMKRAASYADRLSANIEMPTQIDLDKFAPAKTHVEIESSMKSIQDVIAVGKDAAPKGKPSVLAPAGQSTQIIVGATPSSDAVILKKARSLYDSFGLRRVYYSGFSPIPHGDPNLPLIRTPLVREHRLYQGDWLMRYYGFKPEELTASADADLPLDIDPKLHWALRNQAFFPVDINKAPARKLARVPGIGMRNVKKILEIRRYHKLTLADLAKLRVSISRAKFFITTGEEAVRLLDSPKLTAKLRPAPQLDLFSTYQSALTGEL